MDYFEMDFVTLGYLIMWKFSHTPQSKLPHHSGFGITFACSIFSLPGWKKDNSLQWYQYNTKQTVTLCFTWIMSFCAPNVSRSKQNIISFLFLLPSILCHDEPFPTKIKVNWLPMSKMLSHRKYSCTKILVWIIVYPSWHYLYLDMGTNI